MENYPPMNTMIMPPPPPPKPMDMDQQVPMMPPMMESYEQDIPKIGVPVEPFPVVPGVPMVSGFVPQPPGPPPVPVVPPVPVPQPIVMAPGLAMVQNVNFQTGQMSRQLIDPYLAAEISSIVHTLSTSQLVYVLAALKKFLKHAPSEARRFLINNPQLTYALLHTQFILGEHDETVLPLSKVDHDISQVNRLERSMHLKPFRSSFEEETTVQRDSFQNQHVVHQQYHEQVLHPQPHPQMDMGTYEKKQYPQDQNYHPVHPPDQPGVDNQVATPSDIDELVNQGIYPASAALVDEVIKKPDILKNIQKATLNEMNSWPEQQKQQVLSIKVALHMRGISVNL